MFGGSKCAYWLQPKISSHWPTWSRYSLCSRRRLCPSIWRKNWLASSMGCTSKNQKPHNTSLWPKSTFCLTTEEPENKFQKQIFPLFYVSPSIWDSWSSYLLTPINRSEREHRADGVTSPHLSTSSFHRGVLLFPLPPGFRVTPGLGDSNLLAKLTDSCQVYYFLDPESLYLWRKLANLTD